MAFNKQSSSITLTIGLIALIAVPVLETSNIDCQGKAFHCVNSTHFKICVDFGGVSKTVDDFLIPCPPTTVCTDNNYFECEYEITTTSAILPVQSDVTNEIFDWTATSSSDIFDVTAYNLINNERIDMPKNSIAPYKLTSEAISTETPVIFNYTSSSANFLEAITNSEHTFPKTTFSDVSESVNKTDVKNVTDIQTVSFTSLIDVLKGENGSLNNKSTTENQANNVSQETINSYKPITEVLPNIKTVQSDIDISLTPPTYNNDKRSTTPVNIAFKNIGKEENVVNAPMLDITEEYLITKENTTEIPTTIDNNVTGSVSDIVNSGITTDFYDANTQNDSKIWNINPTTSIKIAEKTLRSTAVDLLLNKNDTYMNKKKDISSVLPENNSALKTNTHNKELRSTTAAYVASENTLGKYSVTINKDLSSPVITETNLTPKDILTISPAYVDSFAIYTAQDTKAWDTSPLMPLVTRNDFYASTPQKSADNIMLDVLTQENSRYKSNTSDLSPHASNTYNISEQNTYNNVSNFATTINKTLEDKIDPFSVKEINNLPLHTTSKRYLISEINDTKSLPVVSDLKINTDSHQRKTNPNTTISNKITTISPVSNNNEFYTSSIMETFVNTGFDLIIYKNATYNSKIRELSSQSDDFTSSKNIYGDGLSSTAAVDIGLVNTSELSVQEKYDLFSSAATETNRSNESITTISFSNIVHLKNTTDSYNPNTQLNNTIGDMKRTLPIINENGFNTSDTKKTSNNIWFNFSIYKNDINRNNKDDISTLLPITYFTAKTNPHSDNSSTVILALTNREGKFSVKRHNHSSSPVRTESHLSLKDMVAKFPSDVVDFKITTPLYDTNLNTKTWNMNSTKSTIPKENTFLISETKKTSDNSEFGYLNKIESTPNYFPSADFTSETLIYNDELRSTEAINVASKDALETLSVKGNYDSASLQMTTAPYIINENTTVKLTTNMLNLTSVIHSKTTNNQQNMKVMYSSPTINANVNEMYTNSGMSIADKMGNIVNLQNETFANKNDESLSLVTVQYNQNNKNILPVLATNVSYSGSTKDLSTPDFTKYRYTTDNSTLATKISRFSKSNRNLTEPSINLSDTTTTTHSYTNTSIGKNTDLTISSYNILPTNINRMDVMTTQTLKSGGLNIQDLKNKSLSNKHVHNVLKDFQNPIIPGLNNEQEVINDTLIYSMLSPVNTTQNSTTYVLYKNDHSSNVTMSKNQGQQKNTFENIELLPNPKDFNKHIYENISMDQSVPKNLSQSQDIGRSQSANAVKIINQDIKNTLNAEFRDDAKIFTSTAITNIPVNKERAMGNYKYMTEDKNRVHNYVSNKAKEVDKNHISNFSGPIIEVNSSMYNRHLSKDHERSILQTNFSCNSCQRGKCSDKDDCRKFYICIGRNEPIVGECPNNTVFSEIQKQCTKNLSHCIRNNQFRCISTGRYVDIFSDQFYYICVKKVVGYVRFKLQCQKGYHLNKIQLICVLDSRNVSISNEDSSKVDSDNSTNEIKSTEVTILKTKQDFECKKEGKFVYPDDCRKYYECTKSGKTEFRRKIKKCESDKVFIKKKCVDEDSYECNQ